MRILDKVCHMKRLTPDDRKVSILEAAIAVASKGHYKHITRREIAEVAEVSGPLVRHYLGPMAGRPDVLMKYAVENKHLWVVAQGLMAGDRIALQAPIDLQKKARGEFIW